MKIICLHHAGGSSLPYYSWKKLLPRIEVIPIDMPGHGKKIGEPLLYDFHEAISYLYDCIYNIIRDGENYIFFGHSMGGEMLLHVLDLIEKNNDNLPLYIILSGVILKKSNYRFKVSEMKKSEFIAKLIELGGVTPKVTQMVEFEQHYFPILVADFKMLEFEPEFYRQNKFKVRLIIFNGSEDTEAIESEENLASFFMERSEVYHFKGGHFYLFSEENEICKLITELKEL